MILKNINLIFRQGVWGLPMTTFIILQILFFWPNLYFLFIFLGVLLVLNAILIFSIIKDKTKELWPTAIQLNLLFLSTVFFTVFLSRSILYPLYSAAICLFYWHNLSLLWRFLYQPRLYQPYSLERSSIWTASLSLFCLTSELNALSTLFSVSQWLMIIIFFLINLWTYIYYLKTSQKSITKNKEIFIIFSLILLEFYFGLSFLPINYHLGGLLLACLNILIWKLWQRDQKLKLLIVEAPAATFQ